MTFEDQVFGPQSKMTADIEDFALLRSNGMPTYHMASCADDSICVSRTSFEARTT